MALGLTLGLNPVVKNPPTNAGDMGSVLGSGRYPGGGNGNPLQYSCLVNPMDREYLSRLQFMGSQRIICDLVTEHACTHNNCCFVLQMKKV